MKKILHTLWENCGLIKEQVEIGNADTVEVATFGLYTGVDAKGVLWGEEGDQEQVLANLFNLLEEREIKTRVVVGVNPFHSRTPQWMAPCLYCANSHRRMFDRLGHNRKRWRKIEWAFHPSSHTKLTLLKNENKPILALVGGHNLSISKFRDLSLVIKDQSQLKELSQVFNALFEESEPDTGSLVSQFEQTAANAKAPGTSSEAETQQSGKAKGEPTAEEMERFILAVAKVGFLKKEEFTRLARLCSRHVDQQRAKLRPSGEALFASSQAIKEALKRLKKGEEDDELQPSNEDRFF